MIKVKSIGYQNDGVQAEVEYDMEGDVYRFTVQSKLLQIKKMTTEEIKAFIVNRVESERSNKLRTLVEAKLNTLIDVDLEVAV